MAQNRLDEAYMILKATTCIHSLFSAILCSILRISRGFPFGEDSQTQ
nr:hypothetical protein [Providencia rettgeri]